MCATTGKDYQLTDKSVYGRQTVLFMAAAALHESNRHKFRQRLVTREVNERIREISIAHGLANGSIELICECARKECLQRVEVPTSVFEQARREPGRFVVAPGHERGASDRPVDHDAPAVLRLERC